MDQIHNSLDHANTPVLVAWFSCVHVGVWWLLILIGVYVYFQYHQRRGLPDFMKQRFYGVVNDKFDIYCEESGPSSYCRFSIVFSFVSWTMFETMAAHSPVTEDPPPRSMTWAGPAFCAVAVCLVLPLQFLLHLMMCTDVLSKHPKR